MQKHEKLSGEEELLAQVVEECLEEDLSFVPPEREISRKHQFSEDFERAMQTLLDGIADEIRKKEVQRHFSPRYGQLAACILVFCICGYLFYHVGSRTGGSGAEQSSDTAEAAAEEPAMEEAAAEDMDTAAGSSVTEAAEGADVQANASGSDSGASGGQTGREYCNQVVCPAREQEVPERLEYVTTLVNCPVLDEDNPVLILTIGNTGEEDIRYLDHYDLEVWLEDAWYQIPSEAGGEEVWLTLEAGMAVDEEVDLSEYQIDYDASQYRLVTHTEHGLLSVEFTFEEVFKKTMGASGDS